MEAKPMKHPLHTKLLLEVLWNVEKLAPELADRMKWARENGISSRPPGTPGYDNKCEFADGVFLAVKQTREGRAQGIRVVIGCGAKVIHGDPPQELEWDASERELIPYAQDIAPWVITTLRQEWGANTVRPEV
jgi:hypothetical protein